MRKVATLIDSEILKLTNLKVAGTITPAQDSSLMRLILCRAFLDSPDLDLRDLVRIATNGHQNASAVAAGVRTATLSDYLNGRAAMSADTVQKIINDSIQNALK